MCNIQSGVILESWSEKSYVVSVIRLYVYVYYAYLKMCVKGTL